MHLKYELILQAFSSKTESLIVNDETLTCLSGLIHGSYEAIVCFTAA